MADHIHVPYTLGTVQKAGIAHPDSGISGISFQESGSIFTMPNNNLSKAPGASFFMTIPMLRS